MTKIQNIENERFGRLIAKKYLKTKKGKSSTWLCICDCGETTKVELSSLRNGNTKSCGCLQKDRVREFSTKHKMSHSSEYHAWGNMIQRCTNPNNPEYKNYGARGIIVCREWLNSFEVFFKDMGEKPFSDYSLDRKNNDKGYEKNNCRWIDSSTQAINTRRRENKTTGITNISYSKRDDLFYVDIARKGKRHRKSFKVLNNAIDWKEKVLKIYDNN